MMMHEGILAKRETKTLITKLENWNTATLSITP